ncbi:hypothetical protein [Nocardia blacklockiae]|uniref:hypothetical protein n=1 Tax=Nocardia blacklockiae TaxID=480036 RepID=UPI0018931405|nr:hypothetical protein [Nocardia blacklockiae]MBF6173959.1 hypothetical protein [Nocardia blacklockiae]
MSLLSDFFTQPGFGWGALLGAGLVGPIIGSWSLFASDKRKAKQEHAVLDRKEGREDQLREQETVFAAATEFAAECSDVLMNAVDTKAVFNAIRDLLVGAAGKPDPKVNAKLDEAAKQAEATKRITTPLNKLKMVGSDKLVASATRVSTAVLTVLRTVTEPFAQQVTLKAAADELNTFINDFREESGRQRYETSDAERDAMSFMETLKKQVNTYMEEAKRDMKAAGFKTTPWD